ncbi:hypothetical protein D3C75_604790 [compost metagenome]
MKVLQHISDARSPEGIALRLCQTVKRLAVHRYFTAVCPQNPANQMQQRAFTGPAGSGNGYTLSFFNFPLRYIQDPYHSSVHFKLFLQISNLEQSSHSYLNMIRSDKASQVKVVPFS